MDVCDWSPYAFEKWRDWAIVYCVNYHLACQKRHDNEELMKIAEQTLAAKPNITGWNYEGILDDEFKEKARELAAIQLYKLV